MFVKQEQKIHINYIKKYITYQLYKKIYISPPSYKIYIKNPSYIKKLCHIKKFSPKVQEFLIIYSPFFLHIAKGNHQESKDGGGKTLLYLVKSALKAATSTMSSSKSCSYATWVVINVSIIARREREREREEEEQ